MARKNELDLRLRIRVGEDIALGPGKADLLEAIAKTGSISQAARLLNMSYRRAWLLVETMNRCFKTPLVEAKTGGKAGGGAEITPLGREALKHYRAMEKAAARAAAEAYAKLAGLLR
jgi:molybdate transport system regulatory protein